MPEWFGPESHSVSIVNGEWSEQLDSAGWPHWVPGSDPPVYEGLGSNPGRYRVSAECMPSGIEYEDQFFTIEADEPPP